MKKKICVVINSRANYARIKSLLLEIKKSKFLNLQLILGASALVERFGNLEKIITKDKFKIDYKIYYMVEGNSLSTMAKSTGLAIVELSNIFLNERPDIVLTIADRFETIATAISASYMNIPLIHTQGGEITGSIDESVRHAVTKFANLHFPATHEAKKNLIRLGENKKNIFMTGCPSIDLAKSVLKKETAINIDQIISNNNGVGSINISNYNYIVVLQHPVTTDYKNTRKNILKTISAIKKLNLPTVWLWPNIDAGNDIISKELRKFREFDKKKNILFIKNLSPENFLKLILKSKCLVGNSSVGIREASFLGVAAVNIGDRQSGRQHAKNVVFSNYNTDEIVKKIKYQMSKNYGRSKLFGSGDAGRKMVKIIEKFNFNKLQKKLEYK